MNRKNKEIKNAHICNLDKLFFNSFSNPKIVIVISDASIKKNVATLILHIHSKSNILSKTIHHAINITSAKTELFTIRYGINQVVQVQDVKNIIVITNTIHAARHIFDSSIHPYQLQSITIVQDLRAFFTKSSNNSIAF